MRMHFARIAAALSLFAAAACDTPTAPPAAPLSPVNGSASEREEGWEGGAIVRNPGEGKPDATCFFGGTFFTTQGVVSRQPSGNWTLSCTFTDLPPIAEQETLRDWRCSIIGDPTAVTHHSSWVRSPSGTAHLTCHFSDKPLEDAVVSFGDVTAAAQQALFSLPLGDVPGQSVTGETVGVGLACAPIAADLTGKIAVIERGVCTFVQKVQNAMDAGAIGAIVYNSAAFGDQVPVMGGVGSVGIPAVGVGRSTGLALLAASPTQVTITFCGRSASCRGER
jgi:hypothetical protein